jgi:hypothetical protein
VNSKIKILARVEIVGDALDDIKLGEADCALFFCAVGEVHVLETAVLVKMVVGLEVGEPLEQSEELSRFCVLKLNVDAGLGAILLLLGKLADIRGNLLEVLLEVEAVGADPKEDFEAIVGRVPQDLNVVEHGDDAVGVVGVELGNRLEAGSHVSEVLLALEDPDGGAVVGGLPAEVKQVRVHLFD